MASEIRLLSSLSVITWSPSLSYLASIASHSDSGRPSSLSTAPGRTNRPRDIAGDRVVHGARTKLGAAERAIPVGIVLAEDGKHGWGDSYARWWRTCREQRSRTRVWAAAVISTSPRTVASAPAA